MRILLGIFPDYTAEVSTDWVLISFKVISLPLPKDGETGPQGIIGPRGETGATGSPGRNGENGRDGRDGLPGPKGVSVDTAVVNADGQLLFGLSDGKLLRVGNVVGPEGAQGSRGPTGLPGSDGEDGSQILTGSEHPNNADGVDGDLYIATGDPVVPLFKKVGGGWAKQCNLKDPSPKAGKGSGGGGSGEHIGHTMSSICAHFWRLAASAHVFPWLEFVPSEYNIIDGFSRGQAFDRDPFHRVVHFRPPRLPSGWPIARTL